MCLKGVAAPVKLPDAGFLVATASHVVTHFQLQRQDVTDNAQ